MKEIILFSISACASLFILGYVVHMFIGGLVSQQTEIIAITIAVCLDLGVMTWMAYDVIKSRRSR